MSIHQNKLIIANEFDILQENVLDVKEKYLNQHMVKKFISNPIENDGLAHFIMPVAQDAIIELTSKIDEAFPFSPILGFEDSNTNHTGILEGGLFRDSHNLRFGTTSQYCEHSLHGIELELAFGEQFFTGKYASVRMPAYCRILTGTLVLPRDSNLSH